MTLKKKAAIVILSVIIVILCVFLGKIAYIEGFKARASTIKEGMTYTEVVEIMGDEGTDIGSGAIIYEWKITSDTCLYVWFSINRENDIWYVEKCEVRESLSHSIDK